MRARVFVVVSTVQLGVGYHYRPVGFRKIIASFLLQPFIGGMRLDTVRIRMQFRQEIYSASIVNRQSYFSKRVEKHSLTCSREKRLRTERKFIGRRIEWCDQ